jgi:hypothetical protein
MGFKKVSLCLNEDNPEHMELYEFVTKLPNGKKRNGSSFLFTLTDREYQKSGEDYLRQKMEHEQKNKVIKSSNGGIKLTL